MSLQSKHITSIDLLAKITFDYQKYSHKNNLKQQKRLFLIPKHYFTKN